MNWTVNGLVISDQPVLTSEVVDQYAKKAASGSNTSGRVNTPYIPIGSRGSGMLAASIELPVSNANSSTAGSNNVYVETTFVAHFAEEPDIIINYVANAGGSVSLGSETLAPVTGNAAGSVATAASGYHFVNWTNAVGTVVSTSTTYVPAKVLGLNTFILLLKVSVLKTE